MKLQNQVCTIEQGKRLKELGVEAEPIFYWSDEGFPHDVSDYQVKYQHRTTSRGGESVEHYPAYTVAELGAALPGYYEEEEQTPYDQEHSDQDKSDGKWYACYPGKALFIAFTEAQARASMLIHLLETGIITASEVNERINNA